LFENSYATWRVFYWPVGVAEFKLGASLGSAFHFAAAAVSVSPGGPLILHPGRRHSPYFVCASHAKTRSFFVPHAGHGFSFSG
jgi:hypothetical protein